MSSTTPTRFRVLIVGGGVAGLEAALALRELAGERIATTLLTGAPVFVYRPMTVREPFAYPAARHYPLDEIALDIGVELVQDTFKWLDGDRRLVHTEGGETLEYDALLLVRVPDVETLRDVVLERLQASEEIRATQTIFVLEELVRRALVLPQT